jgi:hypothetical protein
MDHLNMQFVFVEAPLAVNEGHGYDKKIFTLSCGGVGAILS